jgi:HAD superfamily hydrolase (TIGR01459 family)
MMRLLRGLSEVAAKYDGFIVDLWGVMHDGVMPYAGALDCLRQLTGSKILLLSNAPRRAASAQAMLRQIGIVDSLYSDILTSGEATWLALRDRTNPWFARLGTRVYHLGPMRDRNVMAGLGLTVATVPHEADFVINTGPDDDSTDPGELAAFIPELDACLQAKLPMICANPDRVVVRAGRRIICAGALAEVYAARGGDVFFLGKPDPAIYRMALERLGVAPTKVLAVGDSLHTDIAGAAKAGLDSLWVLGGIHCDEIGGRMETVHALAKSKNLQPDFVLRQFTW